MTGPSRRHVMIGGAALPIAAAPLPADATARVAADLDRYIGFGTKQAGGPGDIACGNWLAGELERAGYIVERQRFDAPFFDPERSELACGAVRATLWPQPIVAPTGPDGVTGPIVRVDAAGRAEGSLAGAIALVDLPYGRLSTAIAKPVREPIAAAFAAGARGVVAITNGPTGKVIALNADGRKPMFTEPVALLAPRDAGPFLAAAIHRSPATMIVRGTGGKRPAFNFVGRIDRKRSSWLVVSTPRSGWFTCGGERGPGVAAWLWLARWAARSVTGHNLAFVCNSGHEYEYLGASEALASIAPPPAATRFWLHLGANVAARDWHEFPGAWAPLPSVDTQRCLSVSPELVPVARELFRGHAGFEAPYSTATLTAGELTEIVAAGYARTAGCFGTHRYHHVAEDDARCVSAASVAETAAAFQRLVERAI